MNEKTAQIAVQEDILVVDDDPENLAVLMSVLELQGYRVRPVSTGAMALCAAKMKAPDLILLDINMPEMDGFEVCQRLKADPRLHAIPVLFLTADSQVEEKVKAFALGGVDYITKPFSIPEVQARVELYLQFQRNERQLRDSYNHLQDLENLRDGLVHMLVHDLRGPLSSIATALPLVIEEAVGSLSPDSQLMLGEILKISERLVRMVTSVLDVNKLEAGRMQLNLAECDLAQIAHDAIADQEAEAGERVFVFASPGPMPVRVDEEILFRVFQNLLGNALKHTPRGGEVRVEIGTTGDGTMVRVSDCGPGIPKELHKKIFMKFGAPAAPLAQRRHFSTGLGLPFCKLAVEAHGGIIGVDSEPGRGSDFWFRLPATAMVAHA